MSRLSAIGMILLLSWAGQCRADGIIFQLPADGAQVRYDMEMKASAAGQQVVNKGTLTVSSVGQTTVDNEKCRWLEFKLIQKDDSQERMTLSKVLVPEQHLAKGKSPGEKMIRAWFKEGDMPPEELKDLKDVRALAIAAFLSGPPRNLRELDPLEIDNPKLGKLACAGITGDLEIDGPIGTQILITPENRLSDKAPFGLVKAHWSFELKTNGQTAVLGTFQLSLTDINTTALTELPDKN